MQHNILRLDARFRSCFDVTETRRPAAPSCVSSRTRRRPLASTACRLQQQSRERTLSARDSADGRQRSTPIGQGSLTAIGLPRQPNRWHQPLPQRSATHGRADQKLVIISRRRLIWTVTLSGVRYIIILTVFKGFRAGN